MTQPQPYRDFAKINSATLYYEVAGAGHPLIMLHGHLLDSGQWDDQVTAFAPAYQTIRYDARGFGQSTLPPAPYTHYEDLYALLRHLGIDHAYFMGCSGGGATIIDFALTYPAMVDALILVGTGIGGYQPIGPPPPQLLAMGEAMQKGDTARAVELSLHVFTDGPRRTPDQVNPPARERTGAMTARLFARPPVPEAVQQSVEPLAITRLSALTPPTLVIVGGEDQAPLHDIADLLTAQVAGAQKAVIPDAGHHPNLEQPEIFHQVVQTFLQNLRLMSRI
jgi:pimeloyl-ACP methyl ester carboxylesterase